MRVGDFIAGAVALAVLASALAIQPVGVQAEQVKILKRSGSWVTHLYEFGGKRVCFIASRPRKILQGKDLKRSFVRAYVAQWTTPSGAAATAEKALEFSVRIGHKLKPGNSVSVAIDGQRFALFANGETAFVADPAREKRLLKALRKGRRMIIEALTSAGVNTRDLYSLKGSGAALKGLANVCKN